MDDVGDGEGEDVGVEEEERGGVGSGLLARFSVALVYAGNIIDSGRAIVVGEGVEAEEKGNRVRISCSSRV